MKPLVSCLIISMTLTAGDKKMDKYEKTTLGAGCFWCVEAVFERIDGVVDVVAGYAGGHVKDPSYEGAAAATPATPKWHR